MALLEHRKTTHDNDNDDDDDDNEMNGIDYMNITCLSSTVNLPLPFPLFISLRANKSPRSTPRSGKASIVADRRSSNAVLIHYYARDTRGRRFWVVISSNPGNGVVYLAMIFTRESKRDAPGGLSVPPFLCRSKILRSSFSLRLFCRPLIRRSRNYDLND